MEVFKIFKNKGYTMIEIAVVLAITMAMAAVSVPSLARFSDGVKYKETAVEIASRLRLGRQLAIAVNREHIFAIDPANRRYRLLEGNQSTGSTEWRVIRDWAYLPTDVSMATGASCDNTASVNYSFNTDGTASPGAICVKDRYDTAKFTININAISGRVYVN